LILGGRYRGIGQTLASTFRSKVVDQRADPVEVLFQREMAGVEQVKLDVFQVPLIPPSLHRTSTVPA
jgi:hypothetical protein